MSQEELLQAIEEGVENGRISPHLAAFIVTEVLDVETETAEYDDRVRLEIGL